MSTVTSQITDNWTVYYIVCLGQHQTIHQSLRYWPFVRGTGGPSVIGGFPSQSASNAESNSMPCGHHVMLVFRGISCVLSSNPIHTAGL